MVFHETLGIIMTDINSELEDILNKYDKKIELKDGQKKKQLSENNEILTDFEKLCTEVIRPTMEEIEKSIKEHGHDCKIYAGEGNGATYDKNVNSFIKINIYPYPYKRNLFFNTNTPYLSFQTILPKKEIYITRSTMMPEKGGTSRGIGSYKIDEINPEFVHETILSLLREIL